MVFWHDPACECSNGCAFEGGRVFPCSLPSFSSSLRALVSFFLLSRFFVSLFVRSMDVQPGVRPISQTFIGSRSTMTSFRTNERVENRLGPPRCLRLPLCFSLFAEGPRAFLLGGIVFPPSCDSVSLDRRFVEDLFRANDVNSAERILYFLCVCALHRHRCPNH